MFLSAKLGQKYICLYSYVQLRVINIQHTSREPFRYSKVICSEKEPQLLLNPIVPDVFNYRYISPICSYRKISNQRYFVGALSHTFRTRTTE